MPNQATTSDLAFYDIFVPQKAMPIWCWEMESWQTKKWEIEKKVKNPWTSSKKSDD